jgi:hypothetical protein
MSAPFHSCVMPDLVPAIQVFRLASKTWMPHTRPVMTRVRDLC